MALIQTVNKGDIIVERVGGKKRMTPVRKVEHNVCSKPSVHINGRECYDWGSWVNLATGDETLGDLKEELEDVEEASREVSDKEMYEAVADMLVKH